eukprot:8844957-Pyramimonas_sp.AAC.1
MHNSSLPHPEASRKGGPDVSPMTSLPRFDPEAYELARCSQMKGGSLPKCGSRLSAAHMCHNKCKSFTDGGRLLFNMLSSPYHRAHSSSKCACVSRMEGGWLSTYGSRLSTAHIQEFHQEGSGWFSTCDSRPSTAHIRLKSLRDSNRWTLGRLFIMDLAVTPRTV